MFIRRVWPARSFSRAGWLDPLQLRRDMDRLFDVLWPGETGAPGVFPAMNVTRDGDRYYVRAELPGVNRDAIHVEMVEDNLSIQASRTQKTGDREEAFAFSRTLSVPENVQADKVSASYENGVLTVTLPKREEAKPKKVSIAVN